MEEEEKLKLGQDIVLREKELLTALLKQLPQKAQLGFSGLKEKFYQRNDAFKDNLKNEKQNGPLMLEYTCINVTRTVVVLGCNLGIVFVYNRKLKTLSRFTCETKQVPVVSVQLLESKHFIATGQFSGAITIFQYGYIKNGFMKAILKCTVNSHHKSPVTCMQWTPDGTKLFTADSEGHVAITVINMDEGKTHTVFICKEDSPVIQLAFSHTALLISTLKRSLVWPFNTKKVVQVGLQERKVFANFGACFFPPPGEKPSENTPGIYAARPGLRLWKATSDGKVLSTMIFKDSVYKGEPIIETIDLPSKSNIKGKSDQKQFGPLFVFCEKFIVTWKGSCLWVMDPNTGYVIGAHDNFGYVVDASVCENELYVLTKCSDSLIRKIVFETITPCIVVEEIDLNEPNGVTRIQKSDSFGQFEDQVRIDKLIDGVGTKLKGTLKDVKWVVKGIKDQIITNSEDDRNSDQEKSTENSNPNSAGEITSDENCATSTDYDKSDFSPCPFDSSNEWRKSSVNVKENLKNDYDNEDDEENENIDNESTLQKKKEQNQKLFDHLSREEYPQDIVFPGKVKRKKRKKKATMDEVEDTKSLSNFDLDENSQISQGKHLDSSTDEKLVEIVFNSAGQNVIDLIDGTESFENCSSNDTNDIETTNTTNYDSTALDVLTEVSPHTNGALLFSGNKIIREENDNIIDTIGTSDDKAVSYLQSESPEFYFTMNGKSREASSEILNLENLAASKILNNVHVDSLVVTDDNTDVLNGNIEMETEDNDKKIVCLLDQFEREKNENLLENEDYNLKTETSFDDSNSDVLRFKKDSSEKTSITKDTESSDSKESLVEKELQKLTIVKSDSHNTLNANNEKFNSESKSNNDLLPIANSKTMSNVRDLKFTQNSDSLPAVNVSVDSVKTNSCNDFFLNANINQSIRPKGPESTLKNESLPIINGKSLNSTRDSDSSVVHVKISHQRQGSNASIQSLGMSERCKQIKGEANESLRTQPTTLYNDIEDTVEANLTNDQDIDQSIVDTITSLKLDTELDDELLIDGKLYPISPFPAPQVQSIYSHRSVSLSEVSLPHCELEPFDSNNEGEENNTFNLDDYGYDRIDMNNDFIASIDSITDVEDNVTRTQQKRSARLKTAKERNSFSNSPLESDAECRPIIPAKAKEETVQERLRYLADSWAEVKCPNGSIIQHIATSSTLIWIVDNHNHYYYAPLSTQTYHWKKCDGRGTMVATNQIGTVIWCIDRNKVCHYRSGIKDSTPQGSSWEPFEKDMHHISVDIDAVWAIKANGDVFVRTGVSSKKPSGTGWVTVKVSSDLVQITSLNGIVWALDIYNHVQIFQGELESNSTETDLFSSWVELPGITATNVVLGAKSECWIIDSDNGIWFNQDISKENPLGGTWYELSLGEHEDDAWFSSVLSYFTKGNKPKMIVSNDVAGVLILGKLGVLHVAHGHLLGTRWELTVPSHVNNNSCWSCVTAGSHDMNNGFIWVLQPNGQLFCFKRETEQSYNVHPPTNVTLKYCSAGPRSLWALTSNQDVFVRLGISETNPQGLRWFKIDIITEKSDKHRIRLKHVCNGNLAIWALDFEGNVWYQKARDDRRGKDFNPPWVLVEGCPLDSSKFTKIVVGPDDHIVWACDDKNNIYARKGITNSFGVGTTWEVVVGSSGKDLAISYNHVWALCPNGDLICRYGISKTNVVGDYWRKVPGNFEQISVSANDDLWGIDRQGHLYERQTLLFYGNTLSSRAPSYNDLFSDHNDWELI